MTGPANLNTDVTVDSTNAGGTPAGANIAFTSTINGAHNLTLTGGTSGNVTVSGAIGANTALSSLTATGNILTFGNIGGASPGVVGLTSLAAVGALNFSGTTYNVNSSSFTTGTTFNMNSGALTTFTSNGNSLTFTPGTIELSLGTSLTMNSTGGNITVANVDAVTNDLTTLILNAGTGNVQAGSIGTATTNEFNLVSITGTTLTLLGPIIANTVILNGGTGVTYLSANITTNNTPITFTQPVIRNGVNNVTVSTGSTGANITFDSTIDGELLEYETSRSRPVSVPSPSTAPSEPPPLSITSRLPARPSSKAPPSTPPERLAIPLRTSSTSAAASPPLVAR